MNHDPVFAARLADIRISMAEHRARRRRLAKACRSYYRPDLSRNYGIAQVRLVERMLTNPAGPHRVERGEGRATLFAGLETKRGVVSQGRIPAARDDAQTGV